MRAGVYGRQLVTTGAGTFVGVNLGRNAYSEHQGDVREALGLISRKARDKKQEKTVIKASKRWANTPFGGYMIPYDADTYVRHGITFKNTVLLNSQPYDMICIYNKERRDYARMFEENFGKRRSFDEDELLFKPPFSDLCA